VAGLKKQTQSAREQAGADGSEAVLRRWRWFAELAHEQVDRQYAILNDTLFPALAANNVTLSVGALTAKHKAWVRYFRDEIAPIRSPQSALRPNAFPLLVNKS
jgi:polyphosphate kinase